MSDGGDDSREQGIEFGALAEDLTDESYPLGHDRLLERYGDREFELVDGSTTLREALDSEEGTEDEYEDAGGRPTGGVQQGRGRGDRPGRVLRPGRERARQRRLRRDGIGLNAGSTDPSCRQPRLVVRPSSPQIPRARRLSVPDDATVRGGPDASVGRP